MRTNYALVIADSPENAGKCLRVLNQTGFHALAVTTGARAQVQLAFTNPDLIVLDLNLPDMNREVILRYIKAHSRLNQACLILLLNDTQSTMIASDFVDMTLLKPIGSNQLQDLAIMLGSVEISV